MSDANPYFLRGLAAEGQASPYTGKDRIWPMGIILRAMTAREEAEIISCLKMLSDDPKDYTRSWFAWANTLFGELIIKVVDENPQLLGG